MLPPVLDKPRSLPLRSSQSPPRLRFRATEPPSPAPATPESTPSPQAPWMVRAAGELGRMLNRFFCALWPPNWVAFFRKAPAPSPPASENPATSAPAPTEKATDTASVEAPQASTAIPPAGKTPKTWNNRLAQAGGFGVGVLINSFQVGAALFILAGVPLLHAPLWVGMVSVLGVQLLQGWVDKNQSWMEEKIPHYNIRNPEHMKIISRSITRRYDKTMLGGRKFLQKLWLLHHLTPVYDKLAMGGRKLFVKAITFASRHLLNNTINATKIPDHVWKGGFWNKAFYFSKVILSQTLQLLTGPFGKVGKWVYDWGIKLFWLQEATEFLSAFRKPTPPSSPASPPAPAPKPAT